MEDGYLIFEFGSLSVTLKEFLSLDSGFKRNPIRYTSHDRSPYGTIAIRRAIYRPFFAWQVSEAKCTPEEAANLEAMIFMAGDAWNTGDGSIVFSDCVKRLSEPSPRTRPIASDTTAIVHPSGTISYFPKFNVELSEFEERGLAGREDEIRLVSFIITELERIPV